MYWSGITTLAQVGSYGGAGPWAIIGVRSWVPIARPGGGKAIAVWAGVGLLRSVDRPTCACSVVRHRPTGVGGATIEEAWKMTASTASSRRETTTAERVTVNLSARSSAALETAAGLSGDTKTDTINRAIQVYAYLEEIASRGGELFVREPDEQSPVRLRFF